MTSRSSVAPGTMVIRLSKSASLVTLCSRHTATTSWPRSSASPTMCLPSLPDAPTMQTLMSRPPLDQAVRGASARREGTASWPDPSCRTKRTAEGRRAKGRPEVGAAGLPRSEARVQATLHPWRKAPTAISSASTLTIATALDEIQRYDLDLDSRRSHSAGLRDKRQAAARGGLVDVRERATAVVSPAGGAS